MESHELDFLLRAIELIDAPEAVRHAKDAVVAEAERHADEVKAKQDAAKKRRSISTRRR